MSTGQSVCKGIVFVSGASQGIGLGIARRFLQKGYPVAVGYNKHRAGAENLMAEFSRAFPVQVSVENRASIRSAITMARENFGSAIAILVNNGAIAQEKPFAAITDEDWDRMLAVNLRGPFAFTQEVLPPMLEAGWGRIINICSIGGQWGGFNQVHYAAAKAGLINFTRSVAKTYSAQGVTCNAVSPGLVSTDMTANELNSPAGQEKVKNIPARRLGSVEDVAAAAMFLASDAAGYVTGQTINVNGGMYFG